MAMIWNCNTATPWKTLENPGKQGGMLGTIFCKAQNRILDSAPVNPGDGGGVPDCVILASRRGVEPPT